MKPLSAITGRIEDMDSTVLSLTEFAHLTKQLEALNAENADLRAQLEAIGAGGVEPLRARKSPAEDEHDRLAKRGCEIDAHYAHHLAIDLECMLIDPDGNWDSAAKTLDAYKQAWEEINPTPSPFLAEGGIPPERKAIYAAIQAKRAAAGQTDRKELA